MIKKFGEIKEEDVERILEIIRGCYDRSNRQPLIVDLYIFENRNQMTDFLNYISDEMGGKSFWEAEKYYALHDAWTGIPRIMVSTDILYKLPEKVFSGAILHETAHSILHGKIIYYVFSCPRILKENLSDKIVLRLAYLLSVALKDYEVTNFLLKLNFIDEQIAFIEYLLTPTPEEKEEYMLSKLNMDAAAISVASILKTAMCSLPLTQNNENIKIKLNNYVRYLLPDHSRIVFRILGDFYKISRERHDFKGKIKIFSEIFTRHLHRYSQV